MLHLHTVDPHTLGLLRSIQAQAELLETRDNITLASIKDIAAMKLEAVNNRGSRKDFMDVAFLLEHHSLRELISFYRAKYPASNEYMVLRSLVYFDDAELEPMPLMLKPLTWEVAKERICDAVREVACK